MVNTQNNNRRATAKHIDKIQKVIVPTNSNISAKPSYHPLNSDYSDTKSAPVFLLPSLEDYQQSLGINKLTAVSLQKKIAGDLMPNKFSAFTRYINQTMAKPYKWTYQGKVLSV